jgi:seryl-tRNA synthetase
MLVVSEVRENLENYTAGLTKRGIADGKLLLEEVIQLDDQRKETQQLLDSVKNQANQAAKKIGQLMKSGDKKAAEAAKKQSAELKKESKQLEEQLRNIEDQLTQKLYNIPNIPHPQVPSGKSETDNEVIRSSDLLPDIEEDAKPHWQLIEDYGLIDFELGNKVTGAGFPFYKNDGARLVRALVNFFLDEARSTGYQEIQPPVIINEASGYGTGQLPDKEGQMYHLEDTNLYLIPTAEVPITNMYRDIILQESELPLKHAGYTPCFRREAGSWGAHVRGLNRLHQFDKVEIVQIAAPDQSYRLLDEMIAHVEALVQKLELPYRILRLCGGDLGFTSAITYDFEVYSAAQKKWLEISSVSNFEHFQANRLKLRFKDKSGKKHLAHTLNGSALALPRVMAALLENNQSVEGIHIPKVLQPYMGTERITLPLKK